MSSPVSGGGSGTTTESCLGADPRPVQERRQPDVDIPIVGLVTYAREGDTLNCRSLTFR